MAAKLESSGFPLWTGSFNESSSSRTKMLSTCCVVNTTYPLKASGGSTEVKVTTPSSDPDLRIIEIEMMVRTQKGVDR